MGFRAHHEKAKPVCNPSIHNLYIYIHVYTDSGKDSQAVVEDCAGNILESPYMQVQCVNPKLALGFSFLHTVVMFLLRTVSSLAKIDRVYGFGTLGHSMRCFRKSSALPS